MRTMALFATAALPASASMGIISADLPSAPPVIFFCQGDYNTLILILSRVYLRLDGFASIVISIWFSDEARFLIALR